MIPPDNNADPGQDDRTGPTGPRILAHSLAVPCLPAGYNDLPLSPLLLPSAPLCHRHLQVLDPERVFIPEVFVPQQSHGSRAGQLLLSIIIVVVIVMSAADLLLLNYY